MTAKSIFDRRKAFGAVICGVLCLLMLVGLAFLTETDAHAATVTASGTCGDNLTWELDDEGTLTISGSGDMTSSPWSSYSSSIKTVVIGGDVTSIGNYAFEEFSRLTSVTIGDSVKNIGNSAFSWCSKLTHVTMGNSVTSIGEYAFSHCSSLTSVTIPDSVTSIGYRAFWYCGLTSVTIPDSVTSIGSFAFYCCSKLTSITIPDSVTSIGDEAFYYCSSLTSITIPNSVTSIGEWAFRGCTGLTEIKFNAVAMNDLSSNYVFSDAGKNGDGIMVTIGKDVTKIPAYLFCPYGSSYSPKITRVEFEEGSVCKSIGNSAFQYCSSLTSITIPDSVTNVGYRAFSGCSKLTSITIPNSVTSIGGGAFSNTGYYNDEANWENGVLYIGKYLIEAEDTVSDSYTIRDGTIGIADSAFWNCSDLIRVIIPESVTWIGGDAFYKTGYYNDEANWENGVLYIGKYLIDAKYTISGSYTIKDGTLCIADNAFSSCRNLTSITIPDSVKRIGELAFCYCSGLESITVAEGNSKYHSSGNCVIETESKTLILGCKNSVIPSDGSVTSIGSSAFYGCSSLKSITIPDSVTSIGSSAFSGCSSLASVTIPNSVTSIGSYAFSGCSSLASVTIPDSVMSIGDCAFYYCSGLTSITIPNSVTSIGERAFQYCSSLTSVTIPDSVTSIGSYAFSGCSSLASITIPNSVTSIGYDAFGGCSNLTSVTINSAAIASEITSSSSCEYLARYATTVAIKSDITTIGSYITSNFTNVDTAEIGGVEYKVYSKHTHGENSTNWTVTENGDKVCSDCGFTIPAAPKPTKTEGYCGNNVKWAYDDENSTLTISGKGEMKDYSGTDMPWYDYAPKIKVIVICEGVTSIGKNAFSCASVTFVFTEISLPSTLTSIGSYAFYSCEALVKITIPSSVDTIGKNAFGKSGLTDVTFEGENGWSMGGDSSYSFGGSSAVDALVNGQSDKTWTSSSSGSATVSVIALGKCGSGVDWSLDDEGTLTISGSGAMDDYSGTSMPWYDYASKIKIIVICEGVTSIGDNAFNCVSITFVFTEISLPSTLTSIGSYAFYSCEALVEITIPASVNSIGEFAFRRSGLTDVTFEGENGWSMGDGNTYSFAGSSAVDALVNGKYGAAWTSVVGESDTVSTVALGRCGKGISWMLDVNGVLTVSGNGAMFNYGSNTAPWTSYRTQIKSVVIGEGVTYIGNCAFYECANIESVKLPSTLTGIGNYTFYSCKALVGVSVSDDVTVIGIYAFRKCVALTVTFENAEGWSYGDSDAEISAEALKANYKNAWTRA